MVKRRMGYGDNSSPGEVTEAREIGRVRRLKPSIFGDLEEVHPLAVLKGLLPT